MKNNETFINEKSGISIEEQQEIMTQINRIAEKNRSELSRNPVSEKGFFTAKKNGAVFPLILNITAVCALGLGVLFLFLFNGRIDAHARTGNSVLNITERALIDEIRKNTAEEIAEKDAQIASIAMRMKDIDDELMQLLQSGGNELTAAQRASQNRLIAVQNSYREEFSILQGERTQILESSRQRETNLRAQNTPYINPDEFNSAMRQLNQLTNERERLSAVEALFSGGYAVVNEQTQRSHNESDNSGQFDLVTRNAQLQDNITELQKTIDALSSGGTGLTRRISELEQNISALQQSTNEKDSAISQLENENTNFASSINQLRADNTAKDQEIANLRNQLAIIRQLLQD
ncbi:MAG: hypothetical protein FWD28_03270 [Treponema sp.]|nr:hypothetical protein [Treponema sp.]